MKKKDTTRKKSLVGIATKQEIERFKILVNQKAALRIELGNAHKESQEL